MVVVMKALPKDTWWCNWGNMYCEPKIDAPLIYFPTAIHVWMCLYTQNVL